MIMTTQQPFIITISRYDTRNYDLVINMDNVPDENAAVDLILQYLGVK